MPGRIHFSLGTVKGRIEFVLVERNRLAHVDDVCCLLVNVDDEWLDKSL